MQFTMELERVEDGGLQIMYGINGDAISPNRPATTCPATQAHAVRIGNGAFDQRQNDVYGAVLDAILLHRDAASASHVGCGRSSRPRPTCATAVWRDPDQGIWEARGKPQHYVSSKLMCWVALDRAAKLAAIRGDADQEATWAATAEAIKADILAHGVDGRGVLRQHYETDALDASNLLAAISDSCPPTTSACAAASWPSPASSPTTVLFLRYRTDETDDGLSGKEGTFLICSFWLVSALAIIGEERARRDLMDRLLRVASPLGLYAEEYDTDTAHHLGNFPQAFSHLALIEAAARIILLERVAELT